MSFERTPKTKVQLSALDAAIILYHVHKGAIHPIVGFEDCERTLGKLTEELSPKRTPVSLDAIESALWSCNLMDESGQWWSPVGESFHDFATRVLKYMDEDTKLRFDRIYNIIRKID